MANINETHWEGNALVSTPVAKGTARCATKLGDTFDKELGRQEALRKALDPGTCVLSREIRRQLWESYWERGK